MEGLEAADLVCDWRWRLNNFYHIIDKDGQRLQLKENWIQKQINESQKRRKLILKYRQGGVTTNEVIKQLDFVAFSKNKTACIMADRADNMEKIFDKVRFAHKHMPQEFQPRLDKGGGSRYEMRFPSLDSSIYCDLEGRGGTIHWLHISEAAFADPQRIRSTLEAVPKDGVVTFETTANGMGNDFYKRWINPSAIYEKLFFPWYLHPEYFLAGRTIENYTDDELQLKNYVLKTYGVQLTDEQIAWRRFKKEDQQELFYQEYAEDDITCFLSSGNAVFDLKQIKRLIDQCPVNDQEVHEQIFIPFDKKRVYVCGADTAEGRGGDYSVATIYDAVTLEQCAQIRSNKWKPSLFAENIYNLCLKYTPSSKRMPLLAVERNNHGHAVLQVLEEQLHYPNLFCFKDDVSGWLTDKITRPVMLNTFIDGVENGTLKLKSRDTLEECLTLVNNDGKIEAADGEHDDTIIASSIAVQMCIRYAGELQMYNNLSSKILL